MTVFSRISGGYSRQADDLLKIGWMTAAAGGIFSGLVIVWEVTEEGARIAIGRASRIDPRGGYYFDFRAEGAPKCSGNVLVRPPIIEFKAEVVEKEEPDECWPGGI